MTYSIAVAGKSVFDPAFGGDFRLAWYPTPPPGFTGASVVLFNGASANVIHAFTNRLDLRLTATVAPEATSGPITVVTPYGNVTSSATFQVLPPALKAHFTLNRQMEVAWPATDNAFVLESATSLSDPLWTPVTTSPSVEDGWSRVLVQAMGEVRFLRLRASE